MKRNKNSNYLKIQFQIIEYVYNLNCFPLVAGCWSTVMCNFSESQQIEKLIIEFSQSDVRTWKNLCQLAQRVRSSKTWWNNLCNDDAALKLLSLSLFLVV